MRAWRFSKENRYDLRTDEEAVPKVIPAQLRLIQQAKNRQRLAAAVTFFALVLLLDWVYLWQ